MQSGADQGGLAAAKACGIKTSGWAPLGWITLDGPRKEFLELYNMNECPRPGYPARTALNVRDSDGTLRFANKWGSPGEICTLNALKKFNKPYFNITIPIEEDFDKLMDDVIKWLEDNKIEILNVAGNSEQTFKGMEKHVYSFLVQLFKELQTK